MDQVKPAEGTWNCKVISADYAADDKDIMVARINVQLTEGPDLGRKMTYEEQINNKSARYAMQSMKAVGWKGGRPEMTFKSDVAAWIAATGGSSTVEVTHVERKNGPKAGTYWAKARAIGRGPKPLQAASKQSADDAWEAIQTVLVEQEQGANGGLPQSGDAPPPSDDDLPF